MFISLEKKSRRVEMFVLLVISLIILCMSVGCSEDSTLGAEDSTPVPEVKEGKFIDSAVEGLSYETPSHAGITDTRGTFKYIQGEEITFSLGGIVIGKSHGKEILTPIDLVEGATDDTDPVVTNICRFLQGLDSDGDPENGIQLSEQLRKELQDMKELWDMNIDFTLPLLEFRNAAPVRQLFYHIFDSGVLGEVEESNFVPNIEQARRHFRRSLAKHGLVPAVTPNGVYIGTDNVVDDDLSDGIGLADHRQPVSVQGDTLASLVADNSRFGFVFHQKLSNEGDFIFSPYALSTSLAMCFSGARKDSSCQIATAANFTLDPPLLYEAFNTLDISLNSADGADGDATAMFNSRSAAWAQSQYTVYTDFFNGLGAYFDAPLSPLDFDQAIVNARRVISEWLTGQSEREYPELNDSFSTRTRLAFSSANRFEGRWKVAVDSQDGGFECSEGNIKTVPMIHFTDTLNYEENDLFKAVELFEDTRFGFLMLMPEFGRFEEVEKKLEEEGLSSIIDALESVPLDIYIPEFSMTCTRNLQNELKNMGMVDVWDESKADFTGIHPVDTLCVQNSVHRANISLNETGLIASSWNTVSMQGMEDIPWLTFQPGESTPGGGDGLIVIVGDLPGNLDPARVAVDRPFIFILYERETKALLYSGCISNP